MHLLNVKSNIRRVQSERVKFNVEGQTQTRDTISWPLNSEYCLFFCAAVQGAPINKNPLGKIQYLCNCS